MLKNNINIASNNKNYDTIYREYLLHNLIKYKLDKYDITVQNLIFEIIIEAINMIIGFIYEHLLQIIYVDLYEHSYDYTYDILYHQYISDNILISIINLEKIECENLLNISIKIAQSFVFKFIMPKRSYNKSYIRKNKNNISYNKVIKHDKITNTILKLKTIIYPNQRSDEWYKFRNSILTASNIWKIFISDYSQTQLILEKCEPLNIDKFKTTNTNSPLHWGQKYEPVSIQYYEYINNTKVDEFGCIPHENYSYIAASPDGIVCDPSSDLYGRMLEIKNVFTREINGIPKMEYWIQMQIQMEVCNLDECDFLETKFVEYCDKEEYMRDTSTNYKGIILQYIKDDNVYYVYAPFIIDIESDKFNEWYLNETDKNKDNEYITTIYWKLEKISCILVLRNKLWFNSIQPYIKLFWENLEHERDTGIYRDRIKKKRKLELLDNKSRSDFPNTGCLIDKTLFT